MELQTLDLPCTQLVAPEVGEVLDIVAHLYTSSFDEDSLTEADVPVSDGLLTAASTTTTSLDSPLRIQSEPSSVLGSGTTTEKVNPRQSEDHAEQRHLPASITAAHVDGISGHSTLGKKRKLDWGSPSHIDAVDGDEDHPIVIPDTEDEE